MRITKKEDVRHPYTFDDYYIGEMDKVRGSQLDFINKFRQLFHIEKKTKIDIKLAEGLSTSHFPIFFTSEEIDELINKIETLIKNREI